MILRPETPKSMQVWACQVGNTVWHQMRVLELTGRVKMTNAKWIYTIYNMFGVAKSKFGSPLLSRDPKQAWQEEDMLFPPILLILATKWHCQNVIYTKSTQKAAPLGSRHPPVAKDEKCATLLMPSSSAQWRHQGTLQTVVLDIY